MNGIKKDIYQNLKMTNKETIQRNIGLTFDFVKHLIDNPNSINELPDYSELSFIEKDFTATKGKMQKPVKSKVSKKSYIKVKNSFEITK
jgi:hypothetical protein